MYLTEQSSSSSIQFDVALISSSAARCSPPSPRAASRRRPLVRGRVPPSSRAKERRRCQRRHPSSPARVEDRTERRVELRRPFFFYARHRRPSSSARAEDVRSAATAELLHRPSSLQAEPRTLLAPRRASIFSGQHRASSYCRSWPCLLAKNYTKCEKCD